MASPQPAWAPKTRLGVKLLFCAKNSREHSGSSGRILHRTSTKNHRGIEINPSALWLTRCFGQMPNAPVPGIRDCTDWWLRRTTQSGFWQATTKKSPPKCDFAARCCPAVFAIIAFFSNPAKNQKPWLVARRNTGKVMRSTAKATPGARWLIPETGPR